MHKLPLTFSTLLLALITTQFVCGQQNLKDKTSPTPIVKDFCFNVVRPGFDGCPVGEDIPAETPLLDAIRHRDVEKVKNLIAQGADVDQSDSRGLTPLLLVSGGDFELIDVLLKAGADVNAESLYGDTPLIRATICSRAVKRFLEAGADVNRRNINKHTALMSAIKHGNVESVRLLLNAKAAISAKDVEEMTPMLYAIKDGNIEMVRLFSARFTDDLLFDQEILAKALSFAAINSQMEMVRFLLDKGADPIGKGKYKGTAFGYSVQKDNVEIVKLLLSLGAEVNPQDGGPPIYWASLHGNPEIVKLLIEAKANVNPPLRGATWTPLIEAARGNHIEVMKLLIKAGADLNGRAYDGTTPLMMAVSAGMHRPQAVKLLIESGADVNMKDDDNEKVYALAIARGNRWDDIVMMLVEAGAVDQP